MVILHKLQLWDFSPSKPFFMKRFKARTAVLWSLSLMWWMENVLDTDTHTHTLESIHIIYTRYYMAYIIYTK